MFVLGPNYERILFLLHSTTKLVKLQRSTIEAKEYIIKILTILFRKFSEICQSVKSGILITCFLKFHSDSYHILFTQISSSLLLKKRSFPLLFSLNLSSFLLSLLMLLLSSSQPHNAANLPLAMGFFFFFFVAVI